MLRRSGANPSLRLDGVTCWSSGRHRFCGVADQSHDAERAVETTGIEVNGFPSRSYADPRHAAQKKPTSPSTQAGHWFAQAVLAAMRLRGKHPGWRSVIALPRFPRYENLLTETAGSLTAAGIEVWWVHPDSRVDPA